MANYVKFRKGSPQAYANLDPNYDNDTLYFIYDEDEDDAKLYLGNKLIAGGSTDTEDSSLELYLNDLLDVEIDNIEDKDILVYDAVKGYWVNLDYRDVVEEFVGATVTAEEPISIDENGVISLAINNQVLGIIDNSLSIKGFEDAEVNAILTKTENGLKWIVPEENRNEEFSTAIDLLNKDITALKSTLGAAAVKDEAGNIITAASGVFAEFENLNSDINNLENAVSRINTTINETKTEISDIKTSIDEIEDELFEKDKTLIQIQSDIQDLSAAATNLENNKADKTDVYTKSETQIVINEAIAGVDHLKRKIVAGYDSIVGEKEKPGADQYIYMVPNEKGTYDEYMIIIEEIKDDDGEIIQTLYEIEKVGDWETDLSNYVTTTVLNEKISNLNTEIEKKVDSIEGSRLITQQEVDKLNNIKDIIQSVDGNNFVLDNSGQLLIKTIETNQISNLDTILNNKVDKVEGSRLITKEEADKLESLSIDEDGSIGISATVNASKVQELYNTVVNIVTGVGTDTFDGTEKSLLGIEIGAEKNYISSINNQDFKLEDGNLSINTINLSSVTGLEEALNSKVSKSTVTDLTNYLNGIIDNHDNRITQLENQMIWQELT